jgi:hypothetical protein
LNERGINIVDDRFRFGPAGTEAWIKSGFLSQDSSLALTHLERQACYFMFSEPAAICQNMFLATEAIGLGGWMHCGILSREIFEALGFTIVEPQEEPGLPNPVGFDRVFQGYCPPYFESMDAAVDAVSGRSCERKRRRAPPTVLRCHTGFPMTIIAMARSRSVKRASPAQRRCAITSIKPTAAFPLRSMRCT